MNTLGLNSRLKYGHWVSIVFIPNRSINYFDSFGEPASDDLKRDLKIIMDTIAPKQLIKFKENTIKMQSVTTDNCGFFAMRFITDMFAGKPFVESTPYSDVRKGERGIETYKRRFKKFGYI